MDTPTTRVVAPPGGASSFSLGWDSHNRNTRSANDGYTSRDASTSRQQNGYMARDGSISRQRDYTVLYSEDIQGMAQGHHTPRQNYAQRSGCGMPRSASTCRQQENKYSEDIQGMPRGHHTPQQNYAQRSGCGMPPRMPRSASTCRQQESTYPRDLHEEMPSHAQQSSRAFGNRPRESSNNFARGSNQNSGNFISDVPTTRVAAPPGGRSSLNLSWGDDAQVPHSSVRASSNQRGMHGAEVPHDSWAGSSGRTSSNPRGSHGYSQDQFPAAEMSGCTPRNPKTFGQRPRESSNTYAHGNNQNCGNVISDVPTTRVVAPPGGRSSLNLAWGDERENDRNVGNAPGTA